MVDGTLLVVDAGRTHRGTVRSAQDALARAGARILGVVLNRVTSAAAYSYDFYGAYGGVVDVGPSGRSGKFAQILRARSGRRSRCRPTTSVAPRPALHVLSNLSRGASTEREDPALLTMWSSAAIAVVGLMSGCVLAIAVLNVFPPGKNALTTTGAIAWPSIGPHLVLGEHRGRGVRRDRRVIGPHGMVDQCRRAHGRSRPGSLRPRDCHDSYRRGPRGGSLHPVTALIIERYSTVPDRIETYVVAVAKSKRPSCSSLSPARPAPRLPLHPWRGMDWGRRDGHCIPTAVVG